MGNETLGPGSTGGVISDEHHVQLINDILDSFIQGFEGRT